MLAFDQVGVELPQSAQVLKIEVVRLLIDRYYEGHPAERKQQALEELAQYHRERLMLARQAQTMAAYNRWMNDKLYAACAELSDEERKLDRHSFFKSIHLTLNHILLADRVWFGRFIGKPIKVASLDQELYASFADLRAERGSTDQDIEGWSQGLTDAQLAGQAPLHEHLEPHTARPGLVGMRHALLQSPNPSPRAGDGAALAVRQGLWRHGSDLAARGGAAAVISTARGLGAPARSARYSRKSQIRELSGTFAPCDPGRNLEDGRSCGLRGEARGGRIHVSGA